MGFFDDLVVPRQRAWERPEFRFLGPTPPAGWTGAPPADWYAPASLPQVREVGAGEYVRVVLTGFSVWPSAVTVHLVVFARRIRTAQPQQLPFGPLDPGALRVGLLLADGHRVTTLDGDPWPAPPPGAPVPLSLRQADGGARDGSGFRRCLDLFLTGLPPHGPLTLVVEWPDEGVRERHTELDATAIRDAAAQAVEVWPGLRQPEFEDRGPAPGAWEDRRGAPWGGGPHTVPATRLPAGGHAAAFGTAYPGDAGALVTSPERRPGDPARYAPRPDWADLGYGDWSDPALVTARLAAGADPDGPVGPGRGAPLHLAAAEGSAEVVAELLRHAREVDAPDPEGQTPLWYAVCAGDAATAALLLGAGAAPWRRQTADYSPGRLALLTPLAPLFERLPGAVPPTAAERAAQDEADRRIAEFAGVDVEGLGVAFVAGLDEEAVIRALGSIPERCPVLDLSREPGPFGTGPGGFDPYDFDTSSRFVGVTAVVGGCALSQPNGSLPADERLLARISAGSVAYGLHFDPAGGTFGTFARGGGIEARERTDWSPTAGSPPEQWLYRLWHHGEGAAYGARDLAYAAARVGVRVDDTMAVTGPPRRWVELPEELLRHLRGT